MAADGLDDAIVRHILLHTRSIAMVGASANPARPSFGVLKFLLARGFDVTPVNPGLAGQSVQGRKVVASLADAGLIQMVDVFRASDQVAALVDEAMRLTIPIVSMQLGVVDHASAERARTAGMTVVMDRCPAIEWHRLALGA